MTGAPSADAASLLPHLADIPRRLAALLPDLARAHARHAPALAQLNHEFAERIAGALASVPSPTEMAGDEAPYFAYLRQLHALQAQWIERYVVTLQLSPALAGRVGFALRQWIEARDPRNFPGTNPDVLRETLRSGGANLVRGQDNLRADLARGRITMSDESAFKVGVDLAATPGAVVYENDLIQLIRYRPATAHVRRTPLLIVPPFINKYYILDLSPEASFVRYALTQGLQVFMISWRNIGPSLGHLGWDDYASSGIGAAFDATLDLARTPALHALGFCIGGTLLASALASCLTPRTAASLTLLASLLDFSDVGEIGHYIDEDFAARCESQYAGGGVLPGAQLAAAFASLRPRELVWKFVVENYLLGKTPPAFDLLHWNGDSANLPGRLFAWYVRELYLHNRLRNRHELRIKGRPLDLASLNQPAFILGTELDHIVPWRSAYASTQLLQGECQFVLAGSGHIAGVVSPPHATRRRYRTGRMVPPDPQRWLDQSEPHSGSWWPRWSEWLRQLDSASRRAPRQLGNRNHPIVEPAPGRYVTEAPV